MGSRKKAPKTALLFIDVINHFEFPDGDQIFQQAARIALQLARLKRRARHAGVPVIYVNDNFGQWRSNFTQLIEYCTRPQALGHAFVDAIKPDQEDYLILKPKHSAFYQTPLDTLLTSLRTEALILAGLTTNSCILCTAYDANMRDFRLFVPADCSAARSAAEHRQALKHISIIEAVSVSPSANIRFK